MGAAMAVEAGQAGDREAEQPCERPAPEQWHRAVEWRSFPQTSERARDLTRSYLPSLPYAAGSVDLDAVLLVVSELVTNAVRHADGVTAFRLEAGPGGVAVLVSDASARRPVIREYAPARAGGFGWRLVHQLGNAVTVRVDPGAGKTIRVHVPVQPPVPAA
ncbi:ATP-binding protein [Streptomyces marincola]|nr:ATP-binding protein [Streptomyces marincola]